ncbi:hypothetical protein [Sphingomonas crocodyli]|uniref:Uncharacterized protein n=1 Tax=Sphingomonas crocodyli TaxID=1979270 RepID=A0A437LXW5_9SPHN|nr:hypothetical protein [Sphingomonas crocodyli]RVT90217.1 hypothetical protein EOD43_18135 [Sphingomonas crocodyli]
MRTAVAIQLKHPTRKWRHAFALGDGLLREHIHEISVSHVNATGRPVRSNAPGEPMQSQSGSEADIATGLLASSRPTPERPYQTGYAGDKGSEGGDKTDIKRKHISDSFET